MSVCSREQFVALDGQFSSCVEMASLAASQSAVALWREGKYGGLQ